MRPPSPPSGPDSGRAVRFVGLAIGLILLASFAHPAAAQTTGVLFAGVDHEPLGAASLEVDGVFGPLTVNALNGGFTYSLDAEGGTIRFGDGISGQRPPTGSWNMEAGYRVGGGASAGVYGLANTSALTLSFDYGPVTTNFIRGTVSQQGQLLLDTEFPPFVTLIVLEWPHEVSLSIEDGEMVTVARWDAPIPIFLPDQSSLPCDEVIFRSQTGGALDGQELGKMNWRGQGLGQVKILGERFLVGGEWFEVLGNMLLTRGLVGHELTHVSQADAVGNYVEFLSDPCTSPPPYVGRQTQGIAIEELVLQAEPEIGTRMEYFEYMQLPNQGRSRIPTHSAEWTDHNIHDPGVSVMGGFAELGALTYTVQVFDDGLLVDTESGLPPEVARASEFVVQHNQSDLDFLQSRASAHLDLGRDVEILVMSTVPRTVMGDRIHIIPEQLPLFPDCVEAAGVTIHRFSNITLKRGVVEATLPPALVFGLMHETFGDAVMRMQNGQLVVANEAWGPGASGPLSGGVRTSVEGLQGYRLEVAGDLDPQQLPSTFQRKHRLQTDGLIGPKTAGLDVEVQNGSFAITADFAALGSNGAQVDAHLGSQRVYTGVLQQQGRVLVDADYNEVEYVEDDQGIVSFTLRWDAPQVLNIDGVQVTADRISERLRHRDRAVTIWDYERLALDSPATTVHKASVRPAGAWLSAVGGIRFQDFTQSPLLIEHLDLSSPTGVEAEADDDAPDPHTVWFEVLNPAVYNALDGDERLSLRIQEEGDGPSSSKRIFSPGFVNFEPQSLGWKVDVNFLDAGYSGFRVEIDGFGEWYSSSSPIGPALSCEAWPSSQIVRGVGDELQIRLNFDTPTLIDTPSKTPVVASGLTLVMVGAGRPPFGAGSVQFLSQGLTTTALGSSDLAVDVPDDGNTPRRARSVVLDPAVPNPFNPRTMLRYRLAEASEVVLAIYDVTGRKVRTLIDGAQPAGAGAVVWHGDDDRGQAVASGSYLVQLRTREGTAQEKIVLVR